MRDFTNQAEFAVFASEHNPLVCISEERLVVADEFDPKPPRSGQSLRIPLEKSVLLRNSSTIRSREFINGKAARDE